MSDYTLDLQIHSLQISVRREPDISILLIPGFVYVTRLLAGSAKIIANAFDESVHFLRKHLCRTDPRSTQRFARYFSHQSRFIMATIHNTASR